MGLMDVRTFSSFCTFWAIFPSILAVSHPSTFVGVTKCGLQFHKCLHGCVQREVDVKQGRDRFTILCLDLQRLLTFHLWPPEGHWLELQMQFCVYFRCQLTFINICFSSTVSNSHSLSNSPSLWKLEASWGYWWKGSSKYSTLDMSCITWSVGPT